MNQLENHSYDELISTIRQMLSESERQSNRMMTITNVGIEMSRARDFEEVLNIVKREAKWLIQFDHCSILFMNIYGAWESKVLVDTQGCHTDLPVTSQFIQTAINLSKRKILNDQSDFLSNYDHKLVIPLHSDSQVIGTVHFAGDNAYTDDDLRIGLFLGYQLASAMDKIIRMQILLMTQQQLADYAKELSVQNEEIETYNYTIAHDLKSPLSMILLKVGLIKMSNMTLGSDTTQHLEDITERIKHMEDMIDQLLILSQLRNDTETMQIVNSNQVLERCLKRFLEIEMGQVGISVQENMPSIVAHAQWIEEIFANLIGNAIKYMGDDNTAPRVRIFAKTNSNEAIFHVVDNGIGIRQEHQTKLFKKFERLKDVQAEGLGLGLSIVQRIVEHLGGNLGVESEWGQGTTFWFSIPILFTEHFQDDMSD